MWQKVKKNYPNLKLLSFSYVCVQITCYSEKENDGWET